MNQIIISDLELNLELDRQALSGVMGGQRRGGFKPNQRNRRNGYQGGYQYYYKEKYQEYSSYKYPKFENYGCCC